MLRLRAGSGVSASSPLQQTVRSKAVENCNIKKRPCFRGSSRLLTCRPFCFAGRTATAMTRCRRRGSLPWGFSVLAALVWLHRERRLAMHTHTLPIRRQAVGCCTLARTRTWMSDALTDGWMDGRRGGRRGQGRARARRVAGGEAGGGGGCARSRPLESCASRWWWRQQEKLAPALRFLARMAWGREEAAHVSVGYVTASQQALYPASQQHRGNKPPTVHQSIRS